MLGPGRANRLDGRDDGGRRLHVDVETGIGKGVEGGRESREVLTFAEVDAREFARGELIDPHVATGQPEQVGIVTEDRHPVG